MQVFQMETASSSFSDYCASIGCVATYLTILWHAFAILTISSQHRSPDWLLS